MRSEVKNLARSVIAIALAAFFMIPNDAIAQAASHVVSPSDLTNATLAATQQRQQNVDALNQFFSTPKAQQALESAHINAQQVKTAVSTLSDQELAQLATRVNNAQMDFSAGNITDHDLLIILVCVAALVLIIVAVR